MTDVNHLAFLVAMAAEPEDGGLPLIFADWLEECGDTRAALVRKAAESGERRMLAICLLFHALPCPCRGRRPECRLCEGRGLVLLSEAAQRAGMLFKATETTLGALGNLFTGLTGLAMDVGRGLAAAAPRGRDVE